LEELAVKLDNVSYAYPDGFVALSNVSLEVREGERIAILGPNGAGKSTLLMVMIGLVQTFEGAVQILGMPLTGGNIYEIRKKIGLVFQDPNIQLFCPTIWEDVAFGPLNMGLPLDEVNEKVREALKMVGLEGYEEKPPHHLSVGEKKKAALATVLSMKPEVLILDEPTANLEPAGRTELIKLITNLHKYQKTTLIIATHDVNIVPLVSERVYVLNKGRIVAEGPVREVFSNPRVLEEARLELPILTQLFQRLSSLGFEANPLPLTVDEALEKINHLLKMLKKDA